MVDDGIWWVGSDSSLLVCRDQLRPSFRPWVTATGKSATSPPEMDDLHSLSSVACFLAWSSQLEYMGKLEFMDE